MHVAAGAGPSRWLLAMPWVFVLIWSTGFIVARYGMPHAPPLGFLSLRYALSVLCFLVWIAVLGAGRPRFPDWRNEPAQWRHLAVTGVLMHAGYLGGVWVAVRAGMGAGPVALVVGLQPVLTALWVRASGQGATVSTRQWLGLLLGLAGLILVVWHKLGAGEVQPANFVFAILALLSITAGTLYQKRFVRPCDVRIANVIQLAAALAVTLPLALVEQGEVHWTHPELMAAMAWSVFALTLGGSSLLYLLIQRGAATEVTSLLYLVPPTTALMAWLLFGESLGVTVLAGLVLTAVGVWLVVRAR
jgi:drug/metabolite transporter (DMT)-like permease